MLDIGKTLIVLGSILILVGLIFNFSGKIPGVGRLPGDFLIKRENFTIYIPLTTSILMSMVISLFLLLWNQR